MLTEPSPTMREQLMPAEALLRDLMLRLGQKTVAPETLGEDRDALCRKLIEVESLAAACLRMLGGYTPKLTIKVMAVGDPPIDPDTTPSE